MAIRNNSTFFVNPTANRSLPRTIIGDGNNIFLHCLDLMGQRKDEQGSETKRGDSRNLAALCLWVQRMNAFLPPAQKMKLIMFFDANIWVYVKNSVYGLFDETHDLFERLCRDSKEYGWEFKMVETGTRADDKILAAADNCRLRGESVWIVSNDQFRPGWKKDQHECDYCKEYEWLNSFPDRRKILHGFEVMGNIIELFGSGCTLPVPRNIKEYEAKLKECEEEEKNFIERQRLEEIAKKEEAEKAEAERAARAEEARRAFEEGRSRMKTPESQPRENEWGVGTLVAAVGLGILGMCAYELWENW